MLNIKLGQPEVALWLQNSIHTVASIKSSGRPASRHDSSIRYATVRFDCPLSRSNSADVSQGEFWCKTVNSSGLSL